ncbi:MAG TPA: hypothetical protein VFI47_01260 [Acidimicrobiales bacterium]|nr:hypothetical protein [Acidimicrobiales bacterium]
MRGARPVRVTRALLALVTLVAALAVNAGGAGVAAGQEVDPFGDFTAVTPARILDTRSGLGHGGAAGPIGPGGTYDVQVAGAGGVPATGVQAVVLNVTAVTPTAPSYLTVWPTGLARPEVSNLNFVAGQTVPNAVTVALGGGGMLSVFNSSGAAHVLFDVVGYYADGTGPAGSRFFGLANTRLIDTRVGTGVPAGPVPSGGTMTYTAAGNGGVPAGATAVVMNVTVTQPSSGGWLTVYPAGVARPEASSLNFVPGQTVANLVTVGLSAGGQVSFFNANGATHVIADVVGYYRTGVTTEEGRFVALPPYRVMDTRLYPPPFGPDEVWSLPIAGFEYIPPVGASAVVTNVTATQPTESGWLTVYPNDGCDPPNASTLNFTPGQTVPNMTITRLATVGGCDIEYPGSMLFYNPFGYTHALVDVFGAFTDATVYAPAVAEAAPSADGPAESRSAAPQTPAPRRIDR